MRTTSTFKRIGLLILLVALGLMLVGCATAPYAVFPKAGENEIQVSITGNDNVTYLVVSGQTTANVRIDSDTSTMTHWHYISNDNPESAVISQLPLGNIEVDLYLHESKRPQKGK